MNPLRASGSVDAVGDDRHHHVVGNQLAALHDVLGAQADRGTGVDGRPQHVSGGKLHNPCLATSL